MLRLGFIVLLMAILRGLPEFMLMLAQRDRLT